MLVSDPEAMVATLKRLHALNDGVMFWNEQRTFKLMLRNDPVDAESVACELAVVVDEDDEHMMRLMEMTNDGYIDEPGTLVVESWCFPLADFGIEEAAKVQHAVNRTYLYRVCPCNKYLIKDDGAVCLFCQMTATPESRRWHFCPICCEEGREMHMALQPCCAQRLHSRCLDTWIHKSGDDRCPLCRQPPDGRAAA